MDNVNTKITITLQVDNETFYIASNIVQNAQEFTAFIARHAKTLQASNWDHVSTFISLGASK